MKSTLIVVIVDDSVSFIRQGEIGKMMKNIKVICIHILCFTSFISFSLLQAKNLPSFSIFNALEAPLLANPIHKVSFNVQLFYGTMASSQVETYTISPDQLTCEQTPYMSFSEGFIETSKNEKLLEAVNHYRLRQGLECITSYYNYQELEGYGFLSLTDGLHTLYRIDLSTYEVLCPTFNQPLDTTHQCIYHITADNDHYYVLAKQNDENKVILYALNKDLFSLCTLQDITVSKAARYKQHFALDHTGNLYFIEEDHVVITNAYRTMYLPLSFEPEMLYATDDAIYALSTSNLFLNYATFNEKGLILESGQVNLPNKFVSLVSLEIQDHILYTLTDDALHPLYRNYLTLYDLNRNHMLYCLAFNPPSETDLTLMGAIIEP